MFIGRRADISRLLKQFFGDYVPVYGKLKAGHTVTKAQGSGALHGHGICFVAVDNTAMRHYIHNADFRNMMISLLNEIVTATIPKEVNDMQNLPQVPIFPGPLPTADNILLDAARTRAVARVKFFFDWPPK